MILASKLTENTIIEKIDNIITIRDGKQTTNIRFQIMTIEQGN